MQIGINKSRAARSYRTTNVEIDLKRNSLTASLGKLFRYDAVSQKMRKGKKKIGSRRTLPVFRASKVSENKDDPEKLVVEVTSRGCNKVQVLDDASVVPV